MNRLCSASLAILWLLSPSNAQPHALLLNNLTSDTTKTMLITIYNGDLFKTERAYFSMEHHYRKFLRQFLNHEACTSGNYAACEQIYRDEIAAIDRLTWSKGFQFRNADFVKGLGVYNLTKSREINQDKACNFMLQLTADLTIPKMINHEFLIDCR